MAEPVKNLKVVVCKGPSCSLMEAEDLMSWCADLAAAGLPIQHEESRCTGNCSESPVVEWNGRYLTECSPVKLTERLIEDGLL